MLLLLFYVSLPMSSASGSERQPLALYNITEY
jgi:hypothetical protein